MSISSDNYKDFLSGLAAETEINQKKLSEIITNETAFTVAKIYEYKLCASLFFQKFYNLKESVELLEYEGKKIPKKIRKILEVSEAVKTELSKKIALSDYLTLSKQSRSDPYRLLKGSPEEIISPTTFQWHLHCGILRNIYKRTADPELKKMISFLIVQYLAKSAHPDLKEMQVINTHERLNKKTIYQLGLVQRIGYIRDDPDFFKPYLQNELCNIFETSGCATKVLTDTAYFAELLPLCYNVISPSEDIKNEKFSDTLVDAFTKRLLSSPLKKYILFDLTEYFSDTIFKKDDHAKKYREKLEAFQFKFLGEVALAASQILKTDSWLKFDKYQIECHIKSNTFAIIRSEIKGEIGVTHFIDLYSVLFEPNPTHGSYDIFMLTLPKYEELRFISFKKFFEQTGLRLGAVRGREKLMEFISLDDFLKRSNTTYGGQSVYVEYAPKGVYPTVYPNRLELEKTQLFQNFKLRFENYSELYEKRPAQASLGRGVLNLLEGTLHSISDEAYQAVLDQSEKNELVQQALYHISVHLAKAHNQFDNFQEFSLAMELIMSELTTLLVVFAPFREDEFSSIYKNVLTHVPDELKPFLKVGVGKSAMNIFSGIRMAAGPNAEEIIIKDAYYEEVAAMWRLTKTPEDIMANKAIKEIHLFVGAFNPPISSDENQGAYYPHDPISEIQKLLEVKPDSKSLTVAIDSTIDYTKSLKARKLLETFSDKIQRGELNFVFFRSGQKYDMFGMDHYYGAPFYIINNGDKKWDDFNKLLSNKAFKTDFHSMQWFCLSNKYSSQEMDDYRRTIFNNTRYVLDHVPKALLDPKNRMHINPIDPGAEASFIDLRIQNNYLARFVLNSLYASFLQNKQVIHSRDSFGFIHTSVMEIPATPLIRITLGLDPKESETLLTFFNDIASKLPIL